MAGNRIKGITIEIGGDTTGLKKALSEVDKSLNTTQSALKDVNRLLKLDPKNTELLAQKHGLLKEAISETKERLDALKNADVQAKKQLENGELGKDKYDALQREIIETEEKLKSLKKTIGSGSEALASISAQTEKLGKKSGELAKAIKPVSTAITAVGVASTTMAANFEARMDEVLAISGATKEQFEQLKDKAIEMGAKTKFSASESADAFKYMAMAGWDAESMLDGIEGIMDLAAASGEDLATTSDIVTDALTAFGLKASDAGRFADVLAKTSSKSNTNVSMMGETFKYVAPVAGALGYSIEDAAVAIGLMANSGIKASEAGTSLRSLLTNLSKPSDTVALAMEELGISLTDSSGAMYTLDELIVQLRKSFSGLTEAEKASAAASLAGKTGMSGLLAIVNSSDDDFKKLSKEINNAKGAADEMASVMMDNTSGAIEQLKGALESAAIIIGERLTPYIRKAAEFITKLVEKISALSDEQLDAIVKIGMFIAVLAPVFSIVSKVATGISKLSGMLSMASGIGGMLSKTFTALKTAMSGLFGVIAANPVIFVVTGIIAIIVLLYNKCEWFRNGVNEIINNVVTFFKNLGTAITVLKDNAIIVFGDMINGIKTKVSNIASTVKNGFQGAINFITSLPAKALGWGKDFMQGMINGIKAKISGIVNAVKGVANKIASYLHFSRPDEGPLHYYEEWMPDFLDGLAKGINKNAYKVNNAVKNLASGIETKMNVYTEPSMSNISVSAPAVTVMVGNKQFEGYIVKTATNGINSMQTNLMKARGAR